MNMSMVPSVTSSPLDNNQISMDPTNMKLYTWYVVAVRDGLAHRRSSNRDVCRGGGT